MMKFLCILIFIVLILLILEIAMRFLVCHPGILSFFSRKLQNSISYLYVHGERRIMQFQEGCGCYHPDLGYTLKPGEFVFAQREFSNAYLINSLGVRDSEEALVRPEIVIIGDSFALGWGVNQEDTFAKLLEQNTKLKTLNTSVPSYGTVREMIMLRRVDISNLKYLIIQYCGDDYDENMSFYLNGNRPQIMRAETFAELSALHSLEKRYFFGKYLLLKYKKIQNEWKSQPKVATPAPNLNEVDLFLHVLAQNTDMLSTIPIVVFEMNGRDQTNTFTSALKQKKISNNLAFIQNLIVIDMSQYLLDRHFFVLDGHLNPAGQVIVANLLYNIIKDAGIIK